MPDVINKTFGRGCYCRNCEFAEERENGGFGGWRCRREILNFNNINYNSFCSEGIPHTEPENKVNNRGA